MKYFQPIIASIALAFTIGCTDDKPVDAEIQAAVVASYPQCKMIKLSEVTVENKQKTSDGYSAKVSYELEIIPTPEIKTFYLRMMSDNNEILNLKTEYTTKIDELVQQAKVLRKKNLEEVKAYNKTNSFMTQEFIDSLDTKYERPATELAKKTIELSNEYFEILKIRKLKESKDNDFFNFAVDAFMKECKSPSLIVRARTAGLLNDFSKDEVVEHIVSGSTGQFKSIVNLVKTDKGWVTEL